MKTTIISTILATSFMLLGCEQPIPPKVETSLEHQIEKTIRNIPQGDLEILIIDGCQYIVYKEKEGTNVAYGYMSHKGNCNNVFHCYQTPVAIPGTWETADTTTNN